MKNLYIEDQSVGTTLKGPTMLRNMRACVYCGVSTSEQDTDNQAIALKEWAEQRGYQVVKVYREEESAWRAGHQRELAHLVADARKRKFDLLIVWALDRLSREGSAAILGIVNKLRLI